MPTRAEREQEEREHEEARQKQERAKQQQPTGQNPTDQVNQEQQRQEQERAKQQKAYIDEMNRKIGEVVDNAAKARDKDPQVLNYTVEALKNAAQQLESALPKAS